MCQPLPTAVLHQLKLPEVVLCLFQILLGVADMDFTSPPAAHLGLEGSIPDPDHGIIDFVSECMLKIEEGQLSGGIGASRLVRMVRGSVQILEIGVIVAFQLPIDYGIVCPFDLDIVGLHRLPSR